MDKTLPVILESLKKDGYKLAVATGSSAKTTNLLLKRLKIIHLFNAIITEEKVHHNKPAPDIYLAAADTLGIPPDQCIVVEDAQIGIEAAHSAKMKVIGYMNGFNSAKDLSTAELTINNFYELTSTLHKLVTNS